jgi:hypothetical protein
MSILRVQFVPTFRGNALCGLGRRFEWGNIFIDGKPGKLTAVGAIAVSPSSFRVSIPLRAEKL